MLGVKLLDDFYQFLVCEVSLLTLFQIELIAFSRSFSQD